MSGSGDGYGHEDGHDGDGDKDGDISVMVVFWLILSLFPLKGSPSVKCSECEYMDSQELSWPIESHTISLMTFGKDRWQANDQNATSPPNFLNVR